MSIPMSVLCTRKSSNMHADDHITGFGHVYERAHVMRIPISVCSQLHEHTLLYTRKSCSMLISMFTSIQLFQLRLSTSKAEKSNTSAKGCWE